jgi:hypothetical protein
MFKDSVSLLFWFTAFFLCGHTLHVFHLCFVPVLFSFVFFGVFLRMRLSACSLLDRTDKQPQYVQKERYLFPNVNLFLNFETQCFISLH